MIQKSLEKKMIFGLWRERNMMNLDYFCNIINFKKILKVKQKARKIGICQKDRKLSKSSWWPKVAQFENQIEIQNK